MASASQGLGVSLGGTFHGTARGNGRANWSHSPRRPGGASETCEVAHRHACGDPLPERGLVRPGSVQGADRRHAPPCARATRHARAARALRESLALWPSPLRSSSSESSTSTPTRVSCGLRRSSCCGAEASWLWLLARPGRRRLLHDVRVRAAPFSAGVGLVVLGSPLRCGTPGVLPVTRRRRVRHRGSNRQDEIGNLVGPLSARETLGIWLQSDFRLWPSDMRDARLLSLFALGIVLFGIARELANRELAIPTALFACAAVFLYSRHTQSPYVAAKALVVPAPLVALAAGRGLFRRVGLRTWARQAKDRAGSRCCAVPGARLRLELHGAAERLCRSFRSRA